MVKTVTLDDWIKQEGIQHADLLWLDLQGLEYRVLKTAPETLKQATAIHMEVSRKESYLCTPNYDFVSQWLRGNGYHPIIEAIGDGADMGNVLFVKSESHL